MPLPGRQRGLIGGDQCGNGGVIIGEGWHDDAAQYVHHQPAHWGNRRAEMAANRVGNLLAVRRFRWVAVVHVQDAEVEQQSERVSAECVGRVDDGAGGVSSEARRGHEGEGSVEVCEGVDGVEQGASMAAREAEGDDEDEDMVGAENVSVQRAEGGGNSTGGIAKKKRNKGKRLSKFFA